VKFLKKLVILCSVFIITILIITLLSTINFINPINVAAVTPKINDYELTCTATGTIKSTEKIDINFEYDVVIKKICKNVGEKVKVGDTLFIIDKEKTIELLKETYSESELALYKDYINNYPTEVKSEFDATVKKVNLNKEIKARENVMELSSGSGYIANVYVLENNISDIELGQAVTITGDAFKEKEYKGIVTFISDVAEEQLIGNQKETAVNVKIEIQNPDEDLKSGYNIKANICYGVIKNAISIPYEALKEDSNSYYVYKLFDNYAYKSKVDIVLEDKDFVIVNGNINDSTKLCIINNNTNDNFALVNVTNEGITY